MLEAYKFCEACWEDCLVDRGTSLQLRSQDLSYMTSTEDAVSREAPASLEARSIADRSTVSKKALRSIRN